MNPEIIYVFSENPDTTIEPGTESPWVTVNPITADPFWTYTPPSTEVMVPEEIPEEIPEEMPELSKRRGGNHNSIILSNFVSKKTKTLCQYPEYCLSSSEEKEPIDF